MKILPYQTKRLSIEQIQLLTLDDDFEERIDAIRCNQNGASFCEVAFKELTIDEVGRLLNHLIEVRSEYEYLIRDIEALKSL